MQANRVASTSVAPEVEAGYEARRHTRKDVVIRVGIDAGSSFYTGFTKNISAGGLFIACARPMPVGTRFRVAFSLPGSERIYEANCEVRWLRSLQTAAQSGMPAGMGVRFLDLSPEDAKAIDAYIEQVDTIFYDDFDV